MSEPLIHWSDEPLRDLVNRGPVHPLRPDKPVGLWFSVGDDEDGWRAWCESENYCPESLKWRNEIQLAHDARLLQVRGPAMLDAFTAEYGIDSERWCGRCIDWNRVGERYQGIIIAPYCWSRRLETPWYYGWDCASGCIWDVSCIEAITSTAPERELAEATQ